MDEREVSSIAICPICGSDGGHIVQVQRLALAGLDTAVIGFGYCQSCGHIYQVRPAPDELLKRHYESFSNYTCFDIEGARAAGPSNLTRRLLTLAQAQAPKGTIYEVGCATGYHLVHFARAGWTVGGCDPSPKAVAQAKEIFDLDLDCGPATDTLCRRADLSAVLLSHVLEHMTDPVNALRSVRSALADDGVVILEVPCATTPHLIPPGWFAFEHIHYFSEASLLGALRAAGLDPIEIRICYNAELYPVIAAAAAKTGTPTARSADALAVAQTEAFLEEFIRRDDAFWHGAARRLDSLSGPLYVWGAGVHTAQLFDRTKLDNSDKVKIKAIVDRDSQKWGKRQGMHSIISPEDFFGQYRDEPVIISSIAAQAQIASGLSSAGLTDDRIVCLHD